MSLHLTKVATDYGRGPQRWFVHNGWERWVPLRLLWRHPIKSYRHLFTQWTQDDGV